MPKLGIALYGLNGHQLQHVLIAHPLAEVVATAALDPAALPAALRDNPAICHYNDLEQLLADIRVDLVSLCSPRRREQAEQAMRCLRAGKHVYAEKPCAMTEAELDKLIATAARSGKQFHEMAGTVLEQPYWAMRELVQAGTIGTVIQVVAQKSYPLHDQRPQDENVDGGLLMQVGVHAMRFVEHITGIEVSDVMALETPLGNPGDGQLQIAAGMLLALANGAVATINLNYLNPRGFGSWGNEHVRIFGSCGFVESVDAGARTRLVIGDKDHGPLELGPAPLPMHDQVFASIRGEQAMPWSLQQELHPTRMVIRAKHRQ